VRSSNNREPDWGTTLDFAPDGKLALHGAGYANAGTYALDKNLLKFNATNANATFTVVKLTDKELVLELHQSVTMTRPTFAYRRK
jgi:hypothetical protein